jgi:hypothetical protein
MPERTPRARGQAAPQREKARKAPKEAPDDFEGAEDWIFIVGTPPDARIIAKCTPNGLNALSVGVRDFERQITGKQLIVVVPSEGPQFQKAIEVAARCRLFAATVFEYKVQGLGHADTPDLSAYVKQWSLENLLGLEKPWLRRVDTPEPSTNGDGRKIYLVDEKGRKRLNYAVLTDEEMNIQDASKIKIRAITWFWPYRAAAGEATLFAGDGGLGKSQLSLWMAAATSKGWEWPDHSGRAPLGFSIIVTAEDGADTTITPRLTAMGADLTKIRIITSPKVVIREPGKDPEIDLKALGDLPYWHGLFDRYPDTKLLVIDPVASFLGRGVSDQKNDEVRRVLEPFVEEVIRPRGICFLAITHLNKSLEAKSVRHRVNASIAFVNIPRNVHAVIRDPENDKARIFGQIKCNNAPDTVKSLRYTIETRIIQDESGPVETSMPVFDPELSDVDLNRAMSGEKAGRGPKPMESANFATWLVERLKDHPVRVVDLVVEAQEAGLLIAPTAAAPKPSISPLYNAKRRVPDVHPGWDIEELKIDKLKAWQLVRTGAVDANPSAVPF